MQQKFGLGLGKDEGYSKLIVLNSNVLAGCIFAPSIFMGVLTAQWKTEYGFGIDTASIHQRLWQGFIFMGIALGSLNYSKTTPRKILCSGTFISIIGYFILILAKYAPLQFFLYFQIASGIISGTGCGICFSCCIITPQEWLDKTRGKYSPVLVLGRPICAVIAAPLGFYLVTIYGWVGALLIFIGFVFQQFVAAIFFINQPEVVKQKKSLSSSELMKVFKLNGVLPMFLNSCICSGCVLAGVFSDISNIAVESGLPLQKSATIIIFATISSCVSSPLWGVMTKFTSILNCQIIYVVAYLLSQLILAYATKYEHFVTGLLVMGIGTAGYGGLKSVVWVELVGMKNLSTVVMGDAILSGISAVCFPMLIGICSAQLNMAKLLFYANVSFLIIGVMLVVYIKNIVGNPKRETELMKE